MYDTIPIFDAEGKLAYFNNTSKICGAAKYSMETANEYIFLLYPFKMYVRYNDYF